MTATAVSTTDAPAPAHFFSQGVRRGNLLQVSGQGPMDPATNQYIAAGDVKEQTRRTLENVKAILEAGGASVADVLMFRVYLTTRDDFAAKNAAARAALEKFGELPQDVLEGTRRSRRSRASPPTGQQRSPTCPTASQPPAAGPRQRQGRKGGPRQGRLGKREPRRRGAAPARV